MPVVTVNLMVIGQDGSSQLLLMQDAFAGQKPEFDFQSANGQQFQSSVVPIKDEQGAVQRLMGLTSDIKKRRQAEARLLDTLRENSELRVAVEAALEIG